MIQQGHYSNALRALKRLIVHAKSKAYMGDAAHVAELLNDVEMLPEYLGDAQDRTDKFIEMLHGIAQIDPSCRYIVEEFERGSTSSPLSQNP